MAAATDILNAVEAVLTALYSTIPVKQRRHRPGSGSDPTAGNRAGDVVPGFLLVLDDAEITEKVASFETIHTTYPVQVYYLKNIPPGPWDEDEDARTKRQAIEDGLYKPYLTGVTSVYHVGSRPGKPYEPALGKTQSASSWVFDVTAWRTRPT